MQALLLASSAKDFLYRQSINLYGLVSAVMKGLEPRFMILVSEGIVKRRELWEKICQREVDNAKQTKNQEWINQANELLLQAINEKEAAKNDLQRTKKRAKQDKAQKDA